VVEGQLDSKGELIKGSGPGTSFGGNPPAHYNYTQRIITGVVQQSRGLPVRVVIWTAHESMNDPEKDALVRETIAGPEVAGKALTTTIQRAFNNTLHMQTVGKRIKKQDEFTNKNVDDLDIEYRLYARDHFNANGTVMVRYKACTRGVDGTFPQYFESETPGQVGLLYYEALAKVRNGKSTVFTPTVEG
jgi:hypothetical protein